MTGLAPWLKTHVITGILAVSFAAGITIIIIGVVEGQSIVVIYSGLTFVVSLAILLAAITAAIYAKPAYDEVISQRRPAQFAIDDFSLYESSGAEPLRSAMTSTVVFNAEGKPFEIYIVQPGSTIHLAIEILNAGPAAALLIFNFCAPEACKLLPTDDPLKGHYSAGLTKWFMGEKEILCNMTAARVQVPSDTLVTLHAEIKIPDQGCPWDYGWPMEIMAAGAIRRKGTEIFKSWLVQSRPTVIADGHHAS